MRALRIAAAVIALAALVFGCWLLSLDGQQLHADTERWFGYRVAPDYPDKLPLPTLHQLLLSMAPWFLLAVATAASSRLAAALRRFIGDGTAFLVQAGRRGWAGIAPWEKCWLVLSIGACISLRCAWAAIDPPMLDEAITWLFFAGRGPLVAVACYAAPNNHMLHSAVAALLGMLPMDPLTALRAPALLASALMHGALYLLMRRITGSFGAILGSAIAMAAPLMLQHGHLGRGYALLVLAAVVAIGAASRWLRHYDRRALRLFCMACCIGAHAMPSFLYAVTALFVGLATVSAQRWQVARAAVVVILGVSVLYAPALIISGPRAFLENRWIAPIGHDALIKGWLPHFTRVAEGVLGIPHALPVMLIAPLAAIMLSRREARLTAFLMSLTVLFAMITPLIHGVLPFERTWIYLIIPVSLSAALVLDRFPIPARWSWCAIPLVVLGFSTQVVRLRARLPELEAEAFQAARGCEALRAMKPDAMLLGAQPLSTYVLFGMERDPFKLPWTFDEKVSRTMPGARIGVVARDVDFVAGPADSLLFRDQTGQSIWLRAPAIHD